MEQENGDATQKCYPMVQIRALRRSKQQSCNADDEMTPRIIEGYTHHHPDVLSQTTD